jgi:hypothetical protein
MFMSRYGGHARSEDLVGSSISSMRWDQAETIPLRDEPGTGGEETGNSTTNGRERTLQGDVFDFGGDPNLGGGNGFEVSLSEAADGGGSSLAMSVFPSSPPPQPAARPRASDAPSEAQRTLNDRMSNSPCFVPWVAQPGRYSRRPKGSRRRQLYQIARMGGHGPPPPSDRKAPLLLCGCTRTFCSLRKPPMGNRP